MSSESWPPALKDWVARCLGQMTEFNREEAQAELRQVIANAFSGNTLWTTDWAGVQLESLMPKPSPVKVNLKRKPFESPTTTTKKTKKNALKTSVSSNPAMDQVALNRRAARFEREHQIERQKQQTNSFNPPSSSPSTSNWSNSRLPTSQSYASALAATQQDIGDPNVMDWDRHTIVGTSQEIFKDYLRLTTEPKPEQIRPYDVLQKTLVELKARMKNSSVKYNWICNQFKSLRQDLTVQRIKNEFTVAVYEIHARIALEHSDMVEYNQCQATLKTLYELGIPGNDVEFSSFQILMLLHGRNRAELNLYVGQLTERQKESEAVKHALAVSRAISMGNYHSFFSLYLKCETMGVYIMDQFVERERIKALITISRAYMKIPIGVIANELAMENAHEAREFLKSHDAALFVDATVPDADKILDCKAVAPILARVYDEKFKKVGIRGAI